MSKVANLPHEKTGIEVLDKVLPTGLPATGTVLLLCDPGSGGDNLLRQLIVRRLQDQQSVLYLTLDNFPENIRQLIHGVAEDVEWSSLLFVDCYSKTVGAKTDEAYVEDPENLSAISIVISSVMAEKTVSLIVLDSLNTVIRRRDLRSAIEFLRILVARTRQGKCLSLVMLNRKGFLPATLASAQEIVDGVIELKIEETSRDIMRSLRISKMVGLKHLTMWTPYEITDTGEFVSVIRPVERRENNNLPARLTPLVGRESEVTEARNLFLQKNARLVTFTGPGGAGKSSLGLEVARSLIGQFAEGTYFVSLAQITDSKLLPSAITKALGLRERNDVSTLGVLQEYLRNKEVLLFLDNFEQIVSSALQLADLLTACPKLRLIVTSRQALRIRGEQDFSVPPPSLPNLKRLPLSTELSDYDAVKLLVQRAKP